MISIKPKWCELIANGKKTIEIRKTRPKIETPFKCYIYCTKDKIDTSPKTIWWKANSSGFRHIMNGKVIGEFVCDEIMTYAFSDVSTDVGIFSYYERYVKNDCDCDCLTDDEIIDYGNGVTLYGWHISELKIYDEPKKLTEFSITDKESVKRCKYRQQGGQPEYKTCHGGWIKGSWLCNKEIEYTTWCENCKTKSISKPPQSWCYVDELR